MMENFEYKVSVIVPIYNGSEYLRSCLDSLLAQTIEKNQMEVLLINDGSTDESERICKEYTRYYENFKYYYKENKGAASTRNYGIKRAMGKYIAYLDCDDMYSEETLKNVCDFFDEHYEEIDMVSIPIICYKNGRTLPLHFRYKYETKTDIYDLEEYPYVSQTTMNIVVKNRMKENQLFDESLVYLHEDQVYNNAVLMVKGKIGFVKEAEYMYNRDNGTSTMSTYMSPYYIFETTTEYYEKVFSEYESVPKYMQAMFVHDISWKIKENILMPYHLKGAEYEEAVDRLRLLLDRVDDQIILTCPSTNTFHRHFFMNWKNDKNECTVVAKDKSISVEKNGKKIIKQQEFEVCLYKLQIENNNLRMVALVKSSIFNYMEKPRVYVVVNTVDNQQIRYNLELNLSSESYYHTKVQTNNFWQFDFEYEVDNVESYWIEVEIDGILYPTYYWFAPTCPYSNEIKNYTAIYKEYTIDFARNVFYVKKYTLGEINTIRKMQSNKYIKKKEVYAIRYAADNIQERRIWLYYDCDGVNKDNGFYQFQNDYIKSDGIERYYVNANPMSLELNKYGRNIIQFGSLEHKILYVVAEKIITAFVETENICPFNKAERAFFTDIAHAQVFYLQHGILHAHLPWKYSPARIEADKVVISSYFELNNFVERYKFKREDLIPVGMARFEMMDRNRKPIRRILFAPSWRNYLMGGKVGNEWLYLDDKFIKSDYFIYFNKFLNEPMLEELLLSNDIYLDVKLHPIFAPYKKYFDNTNSHVSFVGNEVCDDEYIMYITDFSSYVFNFAYMKRYIMYYVPDWIQFVSGMNSYRELDLPFEKAFGPLVKDIPEALDEVKRAIENDFCPTEIYKERMSKFFLPMENNREKLYEYMMNN